MLVLLLQIECNGSADMSPHKAEISTIKLMISCIPGKDIHVFYLDRQFLSHPGMGKNHVYLMHRLYRKSGIYIVK